MIAPDHALVYLSPNIGLAVWLGEANQMLVAPRYAEDDPLTGLDFDPREGVLPDFAIEVSEDNAAYLHRAVALLEAELEMTDVATAATQSAS